MKVLFVSSEIYPFAKSGGLADVSYALPKALSDRVDITLMMPLYKSIDKDRFNIKFSGISFKIVLNGIDYEIECYFTLYNNIKCYFLYSKIISEREYLYGDLDGGYEDNDIRFGLFSHAVIRWIEQYSSGFEILHLNDWQSALCAMLSKERNLELKVVFTIHNLAYQGIFSDKTVDRLEINRDYFTHESLEFYGNVNFLKAGILFSDAITTVSKSYAKEILAPEFGFGLDGFLNYHKNKLHGILNAIDSDDFSPKYDKFIWQNYDAKIVSLKQVNKIKYLKSIKLSGENMPLFIFIGRFTWQKGLDILIDAIDELLSFNINIAILGDGEKEYRDRLLKIANSYKNIHVRFGYDEQTSRRMYASADFLLMPSAYEPCGLNQMIAMSYGAIPIVRAVGGLKDSVKDIDSFKNSSKDGYGFVFEQFNADELIEACKRAIELYGQKYRLRRIKKHNMMVDFKE